MLSPSVKDNLDIVGLSMASGEVGGMVQEAKQKRPNPQGLCGADPLADPRKANLLWLSAKALDLPVPVGHPHWLTNPILSGRSSVWSLPLSPFS